MKPEIIREKNRLVLKYQDGLTKRGKPKIKRMYLPCMSTEVQREAVRTLADAMQAVTGYTITGADMVHEDVTGILGPEVRVRKNEAEETLSGAARKRRMQNDMQMNAFAAQTGVQAQTSVASSVSAQQLPMGSVVLYSREATGMSFEEFLAAREAANEACRAKAEALAAIKMSEPANAAPVETLIAAPQKEVKKSLFSKLRDFFIDDSYLKKPETGAQIPAVYVPRPELQDMSHVDWSKVSPVAKLQAKFDAEREQKAAFAATEAAKAGDESATSAEAASESEPDLSHLVKDWDWSKPRPWATKEDEKNSPDFLTRMRANDYKITAAELDQLLSESPYDNVERCESSLTPFANLDPAIYDNAVINAAP